MINTISEPIVLKKIIVEKYPQNVEKNVGDKVTHSNIYLGKRNILGINTHQKCHNPTLTQHTPPMSTGIFYSYR